MLGETNVTNEQVNFEQVARKVCKEVGFVSDAVGLNCDTCDVITNVEAQDSNIAAAVHGDKKEEEYGAGDQGLMFGYATDLRSATQGRATFTMEFDKYAEAPKNVAEAIISRNMG